jgi:hypothetical protein
LKESFTENAKKQKRSTTVSKSIKVHLSASPMIINTGISSSLNLRLSKTGWNILKSHKANGLTEVIWMLKVRNKGWAHWQILACLKVLESGMKMKGMDMLSTSGTTAAWITTMDRWNMVIRKVMAERSGIMGKSLKVSLRIISPTVMEYGFFRKIDIMGSSKMASLMDMGSWSIRTMMNTMANGMKELKMVQEYLRRPYLERFKEEFMKKIRS